MRNVDVVNAFIDALLKDPENTMTAVRLRLSTSQIELKLCQVDPLRIHSDSDYQSMLCSILKRENTEKKGE